MKYYQLLGDGRSKCTVIPGGKPEATQIINVLVEEICDAKDGGYFDRYDIQLKKAKLLAICYHCWGGCAPMWPTNPCSVHFPLFAKSEYIFHYTSWFLYFVNQFDRKKVPRALYETPGRMPWGYYLAWIRSNAIRSTLQFLRECDRRKEFRKLLNETAWLYETGGSKRSSVKSSTDYELLHNNGSVYSETFSEEISLTEEAYNEDDYQDYQEYPEEPSGSTEEEEISAQRRQAEKNKGDVADCMADNVPEMCVPKAGGGCTKGGGNKRAGSGRNPKRAAADKAKRNDHRAAPAHPPVA